MDRAGSGIVENGREHADAFPILIDKSVQTGCRESSSLTNATKADASKHHGRVPFVNLSFLERFTNTHRNSTVCTAEMNSIRSSAYFTLNVMHRLVKVDRGGTGLLAEKFHEILRPSTRWMH